MTPLPEQIAAYRPFLMRRASWFFWNPAEAEDLVQDTLVGALQDSPSAAITDLRGWLLKRLRWQYHNTVQEMHRGKRDVRQTQMISAAANCAVATNQQPSVLLREVCRQLELIPDGGTLLSFAFGQSQAVLSHKAGIREKTLTQRMTRARRRLRKFVGEEGEIDTFPQSPVVSTRPSGYGSDA